MDLCHNAVMDHARYRKVNHKKNERKKSSLLEGRARPSSRWPQGYLNRCQPWLPYVLLILIFAAGVRVWQLLSLPTTLPFSHVEVIAHYQHVSPVELERLIANGVEGGFFSFDGEQFKERLQQQLPWIRSVNLRRMWPATLRVSLTEKQAIAVWNEDQLLSKEGIVFQPDKRSFPQGLPQLRGPAGEGQEVFSTYQQIQEALQSIPMTVSQVTLTDRGAWHVELEGGVQIYLGREDILSRLKRFASVYQQVNSSGQGHMARIDLRYPNGFSIQWKDEKTSLSA